MSLGQLELSITDTGQGIHQEDLPRLFIPFDGLRESSLTEGIGIGLALSQGLVTIMGGQGRAISEIGVGSTFTVSMPTAEAPAPEYLGKIGDEADDPPASVVSSSLLYIEDNPPNVELVESIIQRRPTWKLIHAGHGALGVELAGSSEPTLSFLDLGLPDMNGLDVLRSLRDAPSTSEMPVVVVSADASENQIRKLLSAGAHGYLTKPFDVNDVLGLLDRYAGLPI